MKSILFSLIFLLLSTIPVSAQTHKLEWDHDSLPSETNTYSHDVEIDGVRVDVGKTICAASAAGTTCNLDIPTLKPGSHTIKISATKNGLTSSHTATGFDPSNIPTSPENPRLIIVTVTVQVK